MQKDPKSLEEHLEEFKTVGFTLFPKMLDDVWVKAMRDSFEEIGDRLIPSRLPMAVLSPYPRCLWARCESITYRRTAPQEHKPDLILSMPCQISASWTLLK